LTHHSQRGIIKRIAACDTATQGGDEVTTLLPYLPPFSAAGPVAWQLVATVPLTVVWAVVGVVVASMVGQTKAQNMAHINDDHDPGWPSPIPPRRRRRRA
jgi:hypothetical protein